MIVILSASEGSAVRTRLTPPPDASSLRLLSMTEVLCQGEGSYHTWNLFDWDNR